MSASYVRVITSPLGVVCVVILPWSSFEYVVVPKVVPLGACRSCAVSLRPKPSYVKCRTLPEASVVVARSLSASYEYVVVAIENVRCSTTVVRLPKASRMKSLILPFGSVVVVVNFEYVFVVLPTALLIFVTR